jgi:pectate lyase
LEYFKERDQTINHIQMGMVHVFNNLITVMIVVFNQATNNNNNSSMGNIEFGNEFLKPTK